MNCMTRLTARSSTIFIATSEGMQVYRSLDEIPQPLRRKLLQTTRSMNSATILIADRRGRKELVRALQGEPSELRCRLIEALRARQTPGSWSYHRALRSRFGSLRMWLKVLLPLAASVSLWFFLQSHF
jgi:hypothetical protein